MANLDPLYAGIRQFEASNKPYAPKWDFKLRTWGYGTPVSRYAPPAYGSAGYNQAAELAMRDHAQRSFNAVSKRFPNAPHGIKLALADLHYNTGGKFMHGSGLAKKLDRGDYEGANRTFQQYVNAGGKPYEGLIRRRQWGASDLWNEKYGDAARYGEGGLTARIDPRTGVAAPAGGYGSLAPTEQEMLLPGSQQADLGDAVLAPHEVGPEPGMGHVTPREQSNMGGYGINPLTGLPGAAAPGAPAIHMVGAGYGKEQLPPEGSDVMPGPQAPTTGGWGATQVPPEPSRNPLAQQSWGQTPWTEAMHHQMLTGDSSMLDELDAAAPVETGGLNSLFKGWF